MGNCVPVIDSQRTSLGYPDLEELMAGWEQNYTYEDGDLYNSSLAQPCHPTYCLWFGSSIPPLLAVASILGLLCNLILGVALARSPWLWDQLPPKRTSLFLLSVSGILFAAILPFFAVVKDYGWIFGGPFCQAARGLKYGCLFAQSLVVASTTCSIQQAFAGKSVPLLLFVVGFVCAVPAAMSSSAGTICVSSPKPELLLWSLAHTTFCVLGFVLLPVVMVSARVASKWRGRNQCPMMDITWLFYLFWAPYGVAQLLDKLLQEKVLTATCPLQEHLDYFLGISEGLGTVHCFLCPLIIVGTIFCLQKSALGAYRC